MALSNLDKEVATRLFAMLAGGEDRLEAVRRDYAAYSKLSLLAAQVRTLQAEAARIVEEAELNDTLARVDVAFRKVPGRTYHWYTQGGRDTLSMVGPHEWAEGVAYDAYNGSYVYDLDHTFRPVGARTTSAPPR